MKKYEFTTTEKLLLEISPIPYGIFQYVDERIVALTFSDGFYKLYGYYDNMAAFEKISNDPFCDIHPDDVSKVSDAAVRLMRDEEEYDMTFRLVIRDEYRLIHSKGTIYSPKEGVKLAIVWYMDETEYLSSGDGNENTVSDLISSSLFKENFNRKSNYDYLTGIPNMRYFFELASVSRDNALAEGKTCVIGYSSINGMKYFNKKYGLVEGDKILRELAGILAKYFGFNNSCRMGQDNFAFFAMADEVDEKIDNVIREFDERCEGRVSFRVGIYSSNLGITDASLACDRARFACNSMADKNRSGYIYFSNDMLEYENKRQYVLDNLDRALSENWIQAYYQPIIRTANGRVCDEEALARWIDPEKGMLSPADFIPILEDEKLIYKVDLHMVDQIIKKMKIQAEEGMYVVPASVNLSRTDFDVCDIVQEITDRVDAAGIDRGMLTIEITESVVGSDFDFIKEQVERFQRLGFHVWMDDFGSGYSSLDVLQSIHFDLIKLDMRFMKEFDNGDKSRVIITELMKMALGLGIETVTEGVERADQVEFLKEVGCTKLQGYYFCKPIPFDEIIERHRNGAQIGFENPEESEYYTAIGKINLYDMAAVANEESDMDDEDAFSKYFNSLPMAVLESDSEIMRVVRCNQSYRSFVSDTYSGIDLDSPISLSIFDGKSGANLVKALKICASGVSKIFIDEKNGDMVIHSIIRRIASNPVTGVVACAIVVLGVTEDKTKGITYADVANSLSADYIHLYYVDIVSDEFDEYTPDASGEDLSVERHGDDFFNASSRDALEFLYKDDIDRFVASFNKENVMNTIEEQGSYTINYRLLINGEPNYVSMKAIKMSGDDSHIIIGVSNINTQMKQQEDMEKMKEEQIAFARIAALSGNYICIYSVNPETDIYTEYDATREYEGIGLSKFGDDFFNAAIEESGRAIWSEDLDYFRANFSKENVLRSIKDNGFFIINYRLMIDGKPQSVSLKAVMLEEKEGPQLIIGVSRVDA